MPESGFFRLPLHNRLQQQVIFMLVSCDLLGLDSAIWAYSRAVCLLLSLCIRFQFLVNFLCHVALAACYLPLQLSTTEGTILFYGDQKQSIWREG
jgi:hypothetical protein